VLEGKLGDFSLPDIFQLIALTRKSGALLVTAQDAQGRIQFLDGEVCYAVADVKRFALGARLVQAGLASEEQVLQILESKRSEGFQGSLAQALLESVAVDEAALDLFMRSQIEDAVFDLLRLTEASFTFDASLEPDAAAGISVATEHLIVEGGRRLAEWAAIREHVPSSEVVLVLAPDAGGEDGRVSLTAAQWRVLALVDGRRTVADIVDLSGHGEFGTSRLLAGMVAQNLIEVFQTTEGQTGAFSDMLGRRYRLRRIEELELGAPSRSGSRTDRSAAAAAAGSRPPLTPQQHRGPSTSGAPPTAAPARLAAVRSLLSDDTQNDPKPEPRPAGDLAQADPPKVETPEQTSEEPAAPEAPAATSNGVTSPPATESTDASEDGPVAAENEPASSMPSPGAEPVPGEHAPGKPAPDTPAHRAPVRANGSMDRAQVARELASLGLGGDDPVPPRPDSQPRPDTSRPASVAANGDTNGSAGSAQSDPARRLTRDEDVNKGLLLRLIDGVKGA
jgi:hypothetical protein